MTAAVPARVHAASDVLGPEDKLLLLLAVPRPDPRARAEADHLLRRPLDWAALLGRARAHGVVPLLARNLDAPGSAEAVPAHVRARLAEASRARAIASALLARELARVLRALGHAGIAAIPWKGVALGDALYGDAALRAGSDLDVLVPRAEALRALEALRGLGYRAEFTERFFADLLLRTTIEWSLVRREGSVEHAVDLHWGIGWRSRQDEPAMRALWASSLPARFRGVDTRALSPEWLLVSLCVHAARHRWRQLRWLVDVHELCAQGVVDWARAGEIARAFGWDRAVGLTLAACAALLGTPPPPGQSLPALPAWLTLFPALPPEAEGWRDLFLPVRLLPRRSARLGFVATALLAPTLAERRLLRLPPWLAPLYYALRPARLAGKWTWRLARSGAGRVLGSA